MRSPISPSQRFRVFQRDRFVCQYCGARPPEIKIRVDHIHPVAAGGDSSDENLITACFECNAGKATRRVPGFVLHHRVWEYVKRLPSPAVSDELMRSWTAELVEVMVGSELEPELLGTLTERFDSWNDWRSRCHFHLYEYYKDVSSVQHRCWSKYIHDHPAATFDDSAMEVN
jgi:hypothetical protein